MDKLNTETGEHSGASHCSHNSLIADLRLMESRLEQEGADSMANVASRALVLLRNAKADSERLNWVIQNNADIEAPEAGESSTWVIYTPERSLGRGAGCNRDLRKAIDEAISSANAEVCHPEGAKKL